MRPPQWFSAVCAALLAVFAFAVSPAAADRPPRGSLQEDAADMLFPDSLLQIQRPYEPLKERLLHGALAVFDSLDADLSLSGRKQREVSVFYSPFQNTWFSLSLIPGRETADSDDAAQSPMNLRIPSHQMTLKPIEPGLQGATLSATHKLNERWATQLGISWLPAVSARALEGAETPDAVVPLSWDDSWRYAVGIAFFASDQLAVQAGVSLDQIRANPSGSERGALPDRFRIGMAAKLDYQIKQWASLQIAYTHYMGSEGVEVTGAAPDPENADEVPHDRSGAAAGDVISAQFSIRF